MSDRSNRNDTKGVLIQYMQVISDYLRGRNGSKKVVTLEDGTKINGLGTAIEELIVEENLQGIELQKYAWQDEFIKHGKVEELEEIYEQCPKGTDLKIKVGDENG